MNNRESRYQLYVRGVRCSVSARVNGKNGCDCILAAKGAPKPWYGFQSGRVFSLKYCRWMNASQGSLSHAGAPGSRTLLNLDSGRSWPAYAPRNKILGASRALSSNVLWPQMHWKKAIFRTISRTKAAEYVSGNRRAFSPDARNAANFKAPILSNAFRRGEKRAGI